MLVRNETMYQYLLKFVENNRFYMDACRRNFINHQLSKTTHTFNDVEDEHNVFDGDSEMFFTTLKYSCGLLGVVFVFGVCYEIWRKVKRRSSFTITKQ